MRMYDSRSEPLEPPGLWEDDPDTHCPQCGAVAEIYYRDASGEIVGCEHCLQTVFWYERNEGEEKHE